MWPGTDWKSLPFSPGTKALHDERLALWWDVREGWVKTKGGQWALFLLPCLPFLFSRVAFPPCADRRELRLFLFLLASGKCASGDLRFASLTYSSAGWDNSQLCSPMTSAPRLPTESATRVPASCQYFLPWWWRWTRPPSCHTSHFTFPCDPDRRRPRQLVHSMTGGRLPQTAFMTDL